MDPCTIYLAVYNAQQQRKCARLSSNNRNLQWTHVLYIWLFTMHSIRETVQDFQVITSWLVGWFVCLLVCFTVCQPLLNKLMLNFKPDLKTKTDQKYWQEEVSETISDCSAQNWFHHFKYCDFTHEIKHRGWWPIDVDYDALKFHDRGKLNYLQKW